MEDIFKGKEFHYEKEDKNKDVSLFLKSDFIAKINNYNELLDILKLRNYMFQYENLNNFTSSKNKIYIIGEICNKLSNKSLEQIQKYCNYIHNNNKNYNNPICILMIIFDNNYNDLNLPTRKYPNSIPIKIYKTTVVFGYIPKLYLEDFYIWYNKNKKEESKLIIINI